jgi:hypothetical protein
MDENQSVQTKVIEKVNIGHKEEIQVIKVKNHVKWIYIYAGKFQRLSHYTKPDTPLLNSSTFYLLEKTHCRYVSRVSAARMEISKCVTAASQLSGLEF